LPAANPQAMSRPRADLERQLLRKSLGALTRDRHRCDDCGRTPLAGERIHHYEHGALVCALCRTQHREEPAATFTVPHCEHGHTVRRLRAA
jgi:hypothetical protein